MSWAPRLVVAILAVGERGLSCFLVSGCVFILCIGKVVVVERLNVANVRGLDFFGERPSRLLD